MDENRFNKLVEALREREEMEEVFLLDSDGNILFKSEDFPLTADEAKSILKAWKEKEPALNFQGVRFAILKNDEIQLAAKNIANKRGNVVGSVCKGNEGEYLIAHTKDAGMLLEWSVFVNKVAWM